jgi:predicted TIM-barrel fold metal-dependent hydrolase
MNNAAARAGMMAGEPFRDGVRALGRRGHSFDAFCFHPQLPELVDLARACPETTVVVNHLGVPIAGGPYRGQSEETRSFWQEQLRALAGCDNVVMKLGGITRPLSGDRWDKRGRLATSDEVVEAWGGEVAHAIDTLGPSRCMFESNFPVDRTCSSYAVLWNATACPPPADPSARRPGRGIHRVPPCDPGVTTVTPATPFVSGSP